MIFESRSGCMRKNPNREWTRINANKTKKEPLDCSNGSEKGEGRIDCSIRPS
jgi:hypothetical protein